MAKEALAAADRVRDPGIQHEMILMAARYMAMAERVENWATVDGSPPGCPTRAEKGNRMTSTRTSSCNCGAIRIEARGQPVRVGLCHCTTCRKESGAPFTHKRHLASRQRDDPGRHRELERCD